MTEESLELCRFCQRHMKLTYYCEGCGSSCCSDCLLVQKIDYYICQDCNSKNIEILDSEGKKACKDCGKENITKASQPLKSCPKCQSHNIINIYEKKEELEQKFLKIIKKLRFFINPLRDLINKLNTLRQKIKKARDPPIRCFHFPKMEADLLTLFKLFIQVKNQLREKIAVLFHHLVLNKEYFFDIYAQPNSNIRVIEDILDNLSRNYNTINEFIANNIKTFNENIESHQINLQFIDKVNIYFSAYKRFLSLAEEEKPIYAISAKLINGLKNQEMFKKKGGILFITNYDLSFVHEFGMVKKKHDLIFKAPVNDLIRIKEKGKLFKKLYIEFAYGKYEFLLPPNSISRVIEYILLARVFDETVKENTEVAKELHEIEVDLNDLENFIEEGINSFFSFKLISNKKAENDQIKNYNKNQNSNNYVPQNIAYPSDVFQYNGSQNGGQYPYFQDQNFSQQWNNRPCYSYSGYDPQGQNYFRENNFPPYFKPVQIPPTYDLPYFRNVMRQSMYPTINKDEFCTPNIYNPYYQQNYDPQNFNNFFHNQISDIEERNILMKRLQQAQKFGQPFSNQINGNPDNLFNTKFLNKCPDLRYENNRINPPEKPIFQDYNKNHLSELFNTNKFSMDNLYTSDNSFFEIDREKRKKVQELKKEKYSLKETLKKLEDKFDSGIISKVDYFNTYQNMQKDFYSINQKLKSLKSKIEEEDSSKNRQKKSDNQKFLF